MHYFGGKARIAKPLAEYLNTQLKIDQPFVDLFCGSCNVISKIDSNRLRIANDLHPELMAMWKSTQDGEFAPYRIDESVYKEMKKDKENIIYPAWFRGFIGFGCSFAGKYFRGFAKSTIHQDYYQCALNSTLKKAQFLKDVKFLNKSYQDVELPKGALVYCDIPYDRSTAYSVGKFDHAEFHKWAKQKQSEGFEILVSEYGKNARTDWEIVWSMESKKSIRNSKGVQENTIEILMRP